MSCGSCSTGGCSTGGCNSDGCNTGSCNKMNTHDWLMQMPLPDGMSRFPFVEVSFKKGQHKEFFRNNTAAITGDWVCVESSIGYDIGSISLSGELVRLQMKKRKVKPEATQKRILKLAEEREMDIMHSYRAKEQESLIRSRAITKELKLDMKISDIEFQADGKKAIFYYIAEGRVDFRELIKVYARDFSVKVEMKQIGSRQEAGLIGGIGSCGRELCCSTWLTDFKNVNIGIARYQNLSINQAKLSGQCGRLKCCLNYELDTYLDALKDFPKNAEKIETVKGIAFLQKTDIFKSLMWYSYPGSTKLIPLSASKVTEILIMNKEGQKPAALEEVQEHLNIVDVKEEYIDVVGQASLTSLKKTQQRKKQKSNNKPKDNTRDSNKAENPNQNQNNKSQQRPNKPKPNNPGPATAAINNNSNLTAEAPKNNNPNRQNNKKRNNNKPRPDRTRPSTDPIKPA
jgi:cell fate regulator YaaT (PSP1 superfamily)